MAAPCQPHAIVRLLPRRCLQSTEGHGGSPYMRRRRAKYSSHSALASSDKSTGDRLKLPAPIVRSAARRGATPTYNVATRRAHDEGGRLAE